MVNPVIISLIVIGMSPALASVSVPELSDIQHDLQALGYDPGPVDGLGGPRTQEAIERFQSDQGLPVTGRPDTETLARLEAVTTAKPAGFPADQVDQLVAPIALYPDALVAQVLMASAYPLDIVRATRWVEDHEGLEGEALQKAAAQETWDDSVKALAFFPGVLTYMNKNLDWTQDLGEAFLGQQDEVMDAIQRLRGLAQREGNLASNDKQQVKSDGDTIVIQPADARTVYVPTYTPASAYGQEAPPTDTYYTTYTQPTPALFTEPTSTTVNTQPVVTETSSSTDSLVSFGAGALVGGLLTAAILWDDDDDDYRGVYVGGPGYWGGSGYWGNPGYWDDDWGRPVTIDRDVNIDRNREIATGDISIDKNIGNRVGGGNIGKWEFRPEHRGHVGIRNDLARTRVGTVDQGLIDRASARGFSDEARRPARRPTTLDIEQRLRQPAGGVPQAATRPAGDQRLAAARPAARQKAQSKAQLKRQDVKLKKPQRSTAGPAERPSTAQRLAQAPGRTPRSTGASHRRPERSAFSAGNTRLERASSKRGAHSRQASRTRASRSGGGGRGVGGGRGGGRRG